jgi:hypothetical protein
MNMIQIEMDDARLERLQRAARELGQTPAVTANMLIEEGLRQRKFPGIQFRDTGIGRQAFVPGLRLPVYFLAKLAREVNDDIDTIAEHFSMTADAVCVSLAYIRAYPDEIEHAIAANDAVEDALVASLTTEGVVTIQ